MAFQRLLGPRHPFRLWYHRARALLAALRYGFPARRLTIIGITGSDGKTTTVEMTAHILRQNGVRVGALSTACFRIADEVTWNATQKTSPSPFHIQRFLRTLVRRGCTHAVLEYSSHGLLQSRTDFTWPSVAAITNLSPEHLDYHGSMERYQADKAKLFRLLGGKGTKVLHVEDRTYADYRRIPTARLITYSSTGSAAGEGGDVHLWWTDVGEAAAGSSAVLHASTLQETWPVTLRVPGAFNLENALCAVACAHAAGVPLAVAAGALGDFTGAPGRFERIAAGQPFTVLVDFTVTPNAYRKTLTAARQLVSSGGRLLVLCGSCGDRMREKRPLLGGICSELADVVVVTNEDPYTEDPMRIIDDVWAGIDQTRTSAHRIADRREALGFILGAAVPGDVVLLCGKGADTTMWTAAGQIPWDERALVQSILKGTAG